MSRFKKCQVVMLPTNKKAIFGDLILTPTFPQKLLKFEHQRCTEVSQHFYIISDDEIKEGDWGLDLISKKILKANHDVNYEQDYFKKIIATTDTLGIPQPSQSFIQKYIESYNKGNIITDVLVEYVDNGEEDWCERTEEPTWIERLVPDISPKDNTITIKKVKDSWNREEVITLLSKFYCDAGSSIGLGQDVRVYAEKWINKNL